MPPRNLVGRLHLRTLTEYTKRSHEYYNFSSYHQHVSMRKICSEDRERGKKSCDKKFT